MKHKVWFLVIAALSLATICLQAAGQDVAKVPKGAKVYIAHMDDDFDTYIKTALRAKNVPVVLVEKREDAEFELTGHSDTQKASTAKKVIRWDWRSNEQASIQLAEIKTGIVAWAYSANKQSSIHGKRSTAEACAKHLKDKITSSK